MLHQRSEISSEVQEYNTKYAQNLANSKSSAKGPDLKIGHDRILEKACGSEFEDNIYLFI